jgi:spermidine synthase
MTLRQVVEPIGAHERHVHDVTRVLRSGRTAVQEYAIVELGEYGPALVLDGRVQSTMADEAYYHEALLFPAYAVASRVERALVFGGANGGMLHRLCALPDLREVVQVDIDPELYEITRAALPHLHRGAGEDDRCRLLFGDPRSILEDLAGPFDLVLADLPDATPGSPTQRLFTDEFYRTLKGRLAATGVFATQAGPAQPLVAGFFSIVLKTLRSVFRHATPYRMAVPSYGVSWGFVVASDSVDPSAVPEDHVESAMERVGEGAATVYDRVTHRHMFALDRPLRDALTRPGRVATDDRPPAVHS